MSWEKTMAIYGNLDLSLGPRTAFPRPVLLKWGTTPTALGQVVCGAWLLAAGMAVAAALLAFGNALLGLGAVGLQGVGAFGQLLTLIMFMVSVLGAVLLFVGIVTCSGSPRVRRPRLHQGNHLLLRRRGHALLCRLLP